MTPRTMSEDQLKTLVENSHKLPPSGRELLRKILGRRKRGYRTNRWMDQVRPNLHPKQVKFLSMNELEVLYGGSAGGGKSDALILAAMQYADVPGYSAILFRRTYADLAGEGAIMNRTQSWLMNLDGVRWSSSEKSFFFDTEWTQSHIEVKRRQMSVGDENASGLSDNAILDVLGPPNPSRIAFGYLDTVNDKYRYQGWEFQFCFGKGTPVLMADGSYRDIDMVVVGDYVATLEGPRRVSRAHRPGVRPTSTIRVPGGCPVVSGSSHRVLTANGWITSGDLAAMRSPPYLALLERASLKDSDCPLLTPQEYIHPYSYQAKPSSEHVILSPAIITVSKEAEVFDLTVEGASHYVVIGGIIASNCAFDELTQHPEENYTYLFSRLRRLAEIEIPLRMRSATNPGGQHGEWVLNRFIPHEYLAADEEKQFSHVWQVHDPCEQCDGTGEIASESCPLCEGTGGEKRLFIPARLEDNPSLDQAEYDRSLRKLGAVDRARLKHGRWDVNEEGGLFRASWFSYWKHQGTHFIIIDEEGGVHVVPQETCTFFITADTASKDKTTADYTVICAWALSNTGQLFLLDCYRDRLEVPSIAPEVYKMAFKFDAVFVMIEDASSGIGVIQQLERGIKTGSGEKMRYTVKAFKPGNNDKISRSTVAQIKMEKGEVFFPATQPFWLQVFCSELLMFGAETCDYDDQVDNLTMACWYADGKHKEINKQTPPTVLGGIHSQVQY